MKPSTSLRVAALAALGRATWPSPLRALNLTTHGISSHPPLETISIPSVHSAPSSSSSHPSGATISVSSLPTARSSSSHRRIVYYTLPSTRWQTITRLVLIAVPTTVVDYDGKTRTVTKDSLSTVTNIQPYTTTIIDYKTYYTYKPSPTASAPPRRPIRPYPSTGLDTSRKPSPTPWDPPRKPHGSVRPYPPDDKKKHYKPTYTINVSRPKATCPAGFTCQPDDKYTGERVVIHEANIPWPAPPGCANHCVGGRGCWTECDKPHPKDPSRICPEGYSCQRRKKPASTPVPEHPEQRPAPPAAYPEPHRGPALLPPSPPFISPPVVHPPPVAPPPAVLPPLVSGPATRLPPAAPPSHPCPHRHANETLGAPDTVTKAEAEAGLSVPAAFMAMIFAGGFGFGFFMV